MRRGPPASALAQATAYRSATDLLAWAGTWVLSNLQQTPDSRHDGTAAPEFAFHDRIPQVAAGLLAMGQGRAAALPSRIK